MHDSESNEAATKLEALLDDPETDTRALLDAAKVALRFLPADRQASALARIESGYDEENESGAYEELDYPYGTIDPGLELARTLASVGEIAKSLARIDEREKLRASFFNAEELEECVQIVAIIGESERDALAARFYAWAKASIDQEDPHIYAARWLTLPGLPENPEAAQEIDRILREATAAETITELAMNEHALPAYRARARARLVELADGYSRTLAAAPPSTSRERDWTKHAFAVRQLRAAVFGLSAVHAALSESQRNALAATARRWSQWFALEDTGDWLDPIYTAIAFANGFLAEIPEVVQRFDAQLSAGKTYLTQFDGWQRLFPEARAIEITRTLLL